MITRFVAIPVALLALAAPLDLAAAKDLNVSTLSAEGRARLRPRPTALRMELELRKFGSTAKLALGRLAAGRVRAGAKLTRLSAGKGRIVTGPPALKQLLPMADDSGESRVAGRADPMGRKRPAATLLVSRPIAEPGARLAARPTDGDRQPSDGQLFMAVQSMTVDWPLADDDVERLLLEAHELQAKAAEADVAGAREPSELTARERELLEAAAELRSHHSLPEELPALDLERPAEVLFRYVARLTREQTKQLQAAAFAQAKARASTLAEVAGFKLGGIFDISCQHEAAVSDDDYALVAAGHFHGGSSRQREERPGAGGDETSGFDLGSLQFTVVMSVMFYLD